MEKYHSRASSVAFDPFAGPAIALTAPSTGPQREIWLATRVGADASLAFNESVSLRLRGPLDVNALGTALQQLVDRHEALRSTFSSDGLTLMVAQSQPIELPVIDASGPGADPEARWREARTRAVEEPFDLEQGPLVRALLLRCAPDDHIAILTAHHIVCDGYSTGLLLPEWGALYSAIVSRTAAALPPPDPFSAFASELTERVHSAEGLEDERYWVQRFAGALPVLDLPPDRPRPQLKTYTSQRADVTLPADLVKRLRALGLQEKTSLFTVLLAGFNALLYRLTSQQDVVVGIPTAGQSASGHSRLVGHCVNLLPLRSQISGTHSFRTLLGAVRSAMFDALEHQQFTFGGLLERLPLRRDPSRLPLVSVIFNLDKGLAPSDLRFAGLTAQVSTNPRHFENFELFLNAVDLDGRVELECQYNTDLFDDETVRRWLASYQRLLEGAADDADVDVARLPSVSAADMALLAQWNKTESAYPALCVHELIEAQARRTPSNVAIQFDDRTITYADLDRDADRLAARLRGCGVERGALVGLSLERSIEMMVGLLAILKAGAGYVPLDPAYPAERLRFMIEDSGMRVLLTQRSLRDGLPMPDGHVICIDEPDASGSPAPAARPAGAAPEDVAYVIYTSGSTGRPKGVLVPHRSVVNLLTSVRQTPGMTASDVVLAITTLSFDIAVSELILPLTVGARIVLASRETTTDGMELLRLMRRTGVTFVDATPSTWRLLIDAGWDGGEDLTAICTGEAMPKDLAEALVERSSRVWNGYGPTETTVWSTFYQVTPPVDRVLIGRPVANTQIYILDDQMQVVPIGVPGELYIGGAGVTHGYLQRPELTAERFVSDPFRTAPDAKMYRTGDIARYVHDGNIECLGRTDDQVKIRGFRIELGEIEAALAKHPAVARVAVSAREDRPGDRRLVAYVVARPDAAPDDAELKAHLQGTLPAHLIPAVFARLDALPLTPSGKVDRRSLPAPAAAASTAEAFVEPRTETERLVADLWQQALGVGRIGVHDDFFALGGHSLLASQVLARLRKDHGIQIVFRKLFEAPTVAQFAQVLDSQTPDAAPAERSIPHRSGDGPRPLSAIQERIWLLEAMDPTQRAVHNLPAAWRLTGDLDAPALQRSLNEIVARHETLRTTIEVRDGVAYQAASPTTTVTIEQVDLRGLPDADREPTMTSLLDEATRREYDLGVAPLFRAMLLQLADDDHVLFILPHNVIWDGWSFDIFLRELGACYAAATAGQPSPLAPLAVTYGDFAEWQRRWLSGPESERQGNWWREQLGGDLPVFDMPTDRPRPASPTHAGGNIEIDFTRAEVDALTAIARESGATLFTVLFSIYCLLLHRVTGQDDLVVGTPVRARTRPETEDLIGPFMNMLVMRSRVDWNLTFVEFLARMREVTLDGFSNQEMPLESIGIRPPVLRTFFSLQDARTRPVGFGGLHVRQAHVLPPTASADLMLWMMESNRGLLAMMNYSTELYDAGTMERFMARLNYVVAGVLANPGGRVADLDFEPQAERQRLQSLGEGPDAEATAPVLAGFDEAVRRTPDAIALTAGRRSLTFSEMNRLGDDIAARLQSLGARPGARVAVALERSPELVAALLAIMKTGAAWVALDTTDPQARLRALLEQSTPAIVITDEALRDTLPDPPGPIVLSVDDKSAAGGAAANVVPSLDDAAFIAYEGVNAERTCVVTQRRLATLAAALTDATALTRDDVVLSVSPAALPDLAIELSAALMIGARVVLPDAEVASDPEELLRLASASEATLLVAPPSLLGSLLRADSGVWPRLKTVVIGTVPDGRLVAELLSRTGGVWIAHGALPAGIWATIGKATGDAGRVVLGTPLPGTRVRIVGRDLVDVPYGVEGELWIAGTHDTPFYRTGERARWRSDGRLEFVQACAGRANIDGFAIELADIEQALRRQPAVQNAAVVVSTPAGQPPRLIAHLEAAAGQTYTDTGLRQELRRTLPARMIPRGFVEHKFLPRTSTGAIDAERLEPAASPRGAAFVPPQTARELVVAELWRQALGVQQIGADDNFFELGGHSLLCFQVLSGIERETGHRISPRILLLDSLRQVAAHLDGLAARGAQPAPPAAKRGVVGRLGRFLRGPA